jgi:hypothetical protein
MKRFLLVVGLLVAFFATSIQSPAHAWSLGKDKSSTSTQSTPSKTSDKTYVPNNSAFDPNAKDAKGQTNTQRMEKGLAPIGKDGRPVQIHHENQKNSGTRIEMTTTEHKQQVHPTRKGSEIDRKDFKKERSQHWKDRSKDFK